MQWYKPWAFRILKVTFLAFYHIDILSAGKEFVVSNVAYGSLDQFNINKTHKITFYTLLNTFKAIWIALCLSFRFLWGWLWVVSQNLSSFNI